MIHKLRVLCIALILCMCAMPAYALARDAADTASPSTPISTATPAPTPASPEDLPYRIYIEKGAHTVQVYAKDESGSYTVPVIAFRVAVGAGSKTPRGSFTILSKERWHTFHSNSETRKYTYVQYATRFTGGLYFHSPLYTSMEEDTMINASYKEIGESVTSGCLRMTTGAAHWIYENCPIGTQIEIVNDAPLGLASEELPDIMQRGKDPTDPIYALTSHSDDKAAGEEAVLKLDRETARLKVGGVLLLMPSVIPPDDEIVLSWASSNRSVLTVDESGRIKALKPGFVRVTVFSVERNLSAVCEVVVR